MKILVVSSFLPFPLFSGGHVRLYNILKEISKKHEVTLVCEKRTKQTKSDIEIVKKFCKGIFVIERKKQWSTSVLVQAAISSYPFLMAGHDLPEMKRVLEKLLRENSFDVIHIETFYVMQNLPKTNVPIVLVEHNIEYDVYQRFANNAPLLARPLLQIDIEKIKHWEKFFWGKADIVGGVSRHDLQTIEKVNKDTMLIANGVDLASFPFKENESNTTERTILFLGDFKWIQNRDSALWILKEIWPRIISNAHVKLWIVGKHIPENIKKFTSKDITIDDHAPDKTSEIYKKSDILLAPLRVGGGSGYKILEAMASGVPVVTTPLGVLGLDLPKEHVALVRETPSDLSDAVVTLLRDKKFYRQQALRARSLIEKNYTWPNIVKNLEKAYEKARK